MTRMDAPGIHALRPLIKWTGGKSSELGIILPSIPVFSGRYMEPFVGGGAVWLGVDADACLVNDKSPDLISFYRAVKRADPDFIATVRSFGKAWTAAGGLAGTLRGEERAVFDLAACGTLAPLAAHFIGSCAYGAASVDMCILLLKSLREKGAQYARIVNSGAPTEELAGTLIETAAKAALYLAMREGWNALREGRAGDGRRAALYWMMRSFCYAGMFRFNARGAFNVPYGGQSYNARNPAARLDEIMSASVRRKLGRTRFFNGDFEDFARRAQPTPDDFIFLDPPYDSTFSAYENVPFTRNDQARLADWLAATPAKWMMVIGDTPFIRSLYAAPEFRIVDFGKTYQVNFKNRGDRAARHLMITNYDLPH